MIPAVSPVSPALAKVPAHDGEAVPQCGVERVRVKVAVWPAGDRVLGGLINEYQRAVVAL
jgi:hypothetical protein